MDVIAITDGSFAMSKNEKRPTASRQALLCSVEHCQVGSKPRTHWFTSRPKLNSLPTHRELSRSRPSGYRVGFGSTLNRFVDHSSGLAGIRGLVLAFPDERHIDLHSCRFDKVHDCLPC